MISMRTLTINFKTFGKLSHIVGIYVDSIFCVVNNRLKECKLGVKTFIVLTSNLMTLSEPDKDYYRNIQRTIF